MSSRSGRVFLIRSIGALFTGDTIADAIAFFSVITFALPHRFGAGSLKLMDGVGASLAFMRPSDATMLRARS
jgi:hypothetical protein